MDEWGAGEEVSGEAIEDVEESVAIGLEQEFARLAVEVGIDQHGGLGGVPVIGVVRGHLVIPEELSRFGIEGED